jgi:DNA-binding transcriptional ArsR family regulator
MSRHLKVLRLAGLVEPLLVEADARGRLYRLRIEPLAELRAWVQEVEVFWTAQLGAFAAHVDGRELA